MLQSQLRSRPCAGGAAPFGTQRPCVAARPLQRRSTVARNGPDNAAMAEAMKKAMSDPKMAAQMKAMQEAMQRPEVQAQMAQMQAAMQNQQLRQRMEELKDDPDFADMFNDIKKNGMGALMKYYNDPKLLTKLGSKLGPVGAPGAGPAGPMAAAAGPAAEPEINNLRDAAKYGDEEAVEDFLAIGKDVNEADKEGRTPIHYATAFDRTTIARMLLDEGASVEAKDVQGNTPLHYSAGYGRPVLVQMYLAAGADKSAKNSTGKTPYDLAKMDERNPVCSDADLLAKLAP